MAEKKQDWTVPGSIDGEAAKGTAASHPVLVLDTDGSAAAESVRDTRSPAQIEAELDRTRAHLEATIDELTERLNPRSLARRAAESTKARFVDPRTGLVRRERVAVFAGAAGALAAALFALALVRRRR
jgi:hypothetical protein